VPVESPIADAEERAALPRLFSQSLAASGTSPSGLEEYWLPEMRSPSIAGLGPASPGLLIIKRSPLARDFFVLP
jgi:hypothetical protein